MYGLYGLSFGRGRLLKLRSAVSMVRVSGET